jgi:hypothetical protein
MTLGFGNKDRKHNKKLSATKAANAYSTPLNAPGYESTVYGQQQPYYPLAPAIQVQQPNAYAVSPPLPYSSPPLAYPSPPLSYSSYAPPAQQHHPIYGPTPQIPPWYEQGHVSPPLQPSQSYTSASTVSPATSPPEQERGLRSKWNRSCQDLSAQISSSANKSKTMITTYAIEKPSALVSKTGDQLTSGVTTLTTNYIERPTHLISKRSVQALNQGAALCDRISSKLDAVITSIDDGLFSGQEQDLFVPDEQGTPPLQSEFSQHRSANAVYPSSTKGSNVFSKVWLYSNARLPPHLPPFKIYMPTYPLLCLAATYSERAYEAPASSRLCALETHIPADWRSGTKAMVLKSLPIDDMNTIVFAIRGSQTFMDWAVNYRCDPSSPEGFLDDAGNLCHAGFLHVARKMVKPVAERLRVLLQENPARSNASLLITGHSAGGAVASLLYAHMMNTELQSELSYLTGFFKRVHCITFGAPPISLLPLQKPHDQRHKKSLFYSFINEGDPVPRADRPVVKSLLKLYSSPAPNASSISSLSNFSKLNISATSQPAPTKQLRKFGKPSKSSLQTVSTLVSTTSKAPSWPIPSCALSPAGRLVVLRSKDGQSSRVLGLGDEEVEAVTVDDQMLRNVVYGDPMKHMMRTYKKRVESLAMKAVTGGGF